MLVCCVGDIELTNIESGIYFKYAKLVWVREESNNVMQLFLWGENNTKWSQLVIPDKTLAFSSLMFVDNGNDVIHLTSKCYGIY